MSFERILIQGRWYTVDTDSGRVDPLNGNVNYAFSEFDAWDEVEEKPVKLQYVSINGSVPKAEQPHRIVNLEEED